MENMILNAFPRLKENGMWTKYRINKRHQCKCYVTLPLDHLSDNASEIIKSQVGFDSCKVKAIKGINNVPEKAHKVVAIGVHQTISEDDIKTELAKTNVKINKVQRLKFNGQPTRKVVIQFENEQDMKIALFSGIYLGRMRIRCESYIVRQPLGSTLFWGLKFFFSVDSVCQYTQFANYFGWLAISLGQFEIISIKQNGRQKY